MTDDPLPSELPHSTYYLNAAADLERQLYGGDDDEGEGEGEAAAAHDPEAWRHVRPFPALHRRSKQPIAFVVAGSTPGEQQQQPAKSISGSGSGSEVAELYRKLVGLHTDTPSPAAEAAICETCGQQIPEGGGRWQHEKTLAHQAALPHSFPPHHLPRSSIGLKILQRSGWDPDSRLGLGAGGQGGRFPVKAVLKMDRVGVGARLAHRGAGQQQQQQQQQGKVAKLGAREMRQREAESKRRREAIMGELRDRVDWDALAP